MEIKRRTKKEPKRLSPYERLVRKLERDLREAQGNVITKGDKLLLAEGGKDIEDSINWKKFLARTRVVKKYYADANKFRGYINDKYSLEISYSKEKRYPFQWQKNDKKIAAVFERRPIILDFMNYLFNYNRYLKGKKAEMKELIESTVGKEVYERDYVGDSKHLPAAFVADADFWEEAATALRYSESRLKEVLNEFCRAEIVVKLGSVSNGGRGRPPGVYADGYYSDWGERVVKKPYLKDSKKYRSALRRLSKKFV